MLSASFIHALGNAAKCICLEPATLETYAGDKWFARALPDAVALPGSEEEVAAILRAAQGRKNVSLRI